MSPWRGATALAVALLGAFAAWPQGALAHGLSARGDLPIPTWLFGWGAALVLVVSFVALSTLWPEPRLQGGRWRPMPEAVSRLLTSRVLEVICAAIGAFLLGLVVWSGLRGVDNAIQNFAPTFVYLTFWLGFVPVSVLFGDVFKAFNPWRAIGRLVAAVAKGAARGPLPPPLEYPERLGRWPAVLALVAFGWLELAAPGGDQPSNIAIATLIYSVITFIGMALYGVDRWIERGEGFSVYFNLISRVSAFERRGDRIGVRPLLSGLPSWGEMPGSVTFVTAAIGIVSFDGFSAGKTWNSALPDMTGFFESIGFGSVRALELAFGLGMLAAIVVAYGFYRLGARGARSVGGGFSTAKVVRLFAHSLAPIALVYAAAHYVSFLLLQGQGIIPLISDPLGDGSDLFGTAGTTVDYGLIGGSTFWYIQVGFVVLGHIGALVLAHDRAIAIYEEPRMATRSQYWMLVVMIGFTSLALWLLSEAAGR